VSTGRRPRASKSSPCGRPASQRADLARDGDERGFGQIVERLALGLVAFDLASYAVHVGLHRSDTLCKPEGWTTVKPYLRIVPQPRKHRTVDSSRRSGEIGLERSSWFRIVLYMTSDRFRATPAASSSLTTSAGEVQTVDPNRCSFVGTSGWFTGRMRSPREIPDQPRSVGGARFPGASGVSRSRSR
jgi:hypothetical protein